MGSKADLILELTSKKTKKVTLQLNPKLWQMFVDTAKEEGKKPTRKLEELILKYLDEKGKL
jgi:hypothetical protein